MSLPGAADRRIVAAPAVELVGAGIADEHVGAVVAGGVDGARAGQRRHARCRHRPTLLRSMVIEAWMRSSVPPRLDDHVLGAVDDIGVAAAPPASVSVPVPPSSVSKPAPPLSESLPARPCTSCEVAPAASVSAPARPVIVVAVSVPAPTIAALATRPLRSVLTPCSTARSTKLLAPPLVSMRSSVLPPDETVCRNCPMVAGVTPLLPSRSLTSMRSPPGRPLRSATVSSSVPLLAKNLNDVVAGAADEVSLASLRPWSSSLPSPPSSRSSPSFPFTRVVARQPAQHVGIEVARDDVVQAVAGAVDILKADEPQDLQIGAEGVGDGAVDAVEIAGRSALRDLVADIVDLIPVAAGAADQAVGAVAAGHVVVAAVAGQRVVAVAAVERVAGVVARDLVGQVVAVAEAVGAARQRQVLDEVGEREAERAVDLVRAPAGQFNDEVTVAVDFVGIVAGATGHAVFAAAAIQLVGAAVAEEHVARIVAGGVERARAGQHDVLDAVISRAVEVDRDAGLNDIVGIAAGLDDDVLGAVHYVGVVADAAVERVGTGAAVESVVALAERAARQGVVAGQPVEQIGKRRADERVVERRAVECGHGFPVIEEKLAPSEVHSPPSPRRKPGSIFQRREAMDPGFRRGDTGEDKLPADRLHAFAGRAVRRRVGRRHTSVMAVTASRRKAA